MSNVGATAGAGGAAVATYIANIQKMAGPIAYLDRDDFVQVLELAGEALCVEAQGGILQTKYSYLISAFGLTWYCTTKDLIAPPPSVGVVQAKKINVPY